MLKREVQLVCEKYGLRPSKSKGQNFLIDEHIVKKIISASDLKPSGKILEIGPGLGVLTEALLAAAQEVWAVELDRKAIDYLKDNFATAIKRGELRLIEGDALKIDYASWGFKDFGFKIVANLPYSITSHFFRNFLEFGPKPEEIIVMIQNEVAKRLLAKPGAMNLLALSVQLFSEPEILFTVAPLCFWPEPAVDSAVVRLKLKKKIPISDAKALFRLAKIGFSSKRKQLHNNLSGGLRISSSKIKEIFKNFGWREDIRAQDLSLDDWIKLTKTLN